jgi:drug/metabolite transporter (DMT)-like permease
MQHIPPLVFSSLALLDPALVAILAWAGGVEHLPSAYSWIGGMVVMGGVGLISYAEHKRKK